MLDDNELQIDSYRWTFFLKNKAGTYESISTGNSSTFTIEKIALTLHRKNGEDPWTCENSSVGRARPCQGRGRGFESRFSLQCFGKNVRMAELVDALL